MTDINLLIIGADESVCSQLREVLGKANPFLFTTVLSASCEPERLQASLQGENPAIVFLDVTEPKVASVLAPLIRKLNRSARIIAISPQIEQADLLSLMRHGVREWLPLPVDETTLTEALDRIKEDVDYRPAVSRQHGQLVSFMPAKPGAGTSTAAMHAAHFCAAAIRSRVALLDLDLNCGVQAFLAKTSDGLSVLEAAQYAEQMDETLWSKMVAATGKVDLLRSGTLQPGTRIESPQIHRLLSFAESKYPLTFVDLSGNWEKYAVDAMERSSLIVHVCGSDFVSLHHARRNVDFLREMDVIGKVRFVLNRTSPHGELDRRMIESILGVPPAAFLPNAFQPLQSAIREAGVLKANTPYGAEIQKICREILNATGRTHQEEETLRESKLSWGTGPLRAAWGSFFTRGGKEPLQLDVQ